MNNINDTQLYKRVEKEANNVIKFNEFKEAFSLRERVEQFVKKKGYMRNNNDIYVKYEKIIIKLSWISLPYFKKDEALRLFNDNFQETFEMEYFDIKEKIRHFLLGFILLEDRDKVKSSIRKIMDKNKAILTREQLSNKLSPTVENWIKIFVSEMGTGIVDSIKLRQFLTSNKEIKKLSKEEKNKVLEFIKFYEKLKYSSTTVKGFEGSLPVNTPQFKGYFENGRLVKESKLDKEAQEIFDIVSKNEALFSNKNNDELHRLAGQYSDGTLERKAIEEELERLNH